MTKCGSSVDCKVGDWKPWDECSATCDNGTKTRSREVVQEPMNGGATCPSLEETETCNIGQCEGILLILSYEKCVNRDISETALPTTISKFWKHCSIQTTPQNQGKITSETTFGHSKVVFRPLLRIKRAFSQNPPMARFWKFRGSFSPPRRTKKSKSWPWYIFFH